jgi:ribosome-associated protein
VATRTAKKRLTNKKDEKTGDGDKNALIFSPPTGEGPVIAGNRSKSIPDAGQLLAVVRDSLTDDKAEEVSVIALSGKVDFADFMVIASGRSRRHVDAIAEHLQERLKKAGLTSVPIEGAGKCDWVLVDAGDIIIHVFRPEVRAFYALEKMWGMEFPESGQNSDLGP